MDFRKATDALLESVTLEDLAHALGRSTQAVRQARADKETSAHRTPPEGWEAAVAKLAASQIKHYKRLVEDLRVRHPKARPLYKPLKSLMK